MRRWVAVIVLLLCLPLVAWGANTHGTPSEALERQAWFGDALAGYVVSGCLPGTSGTTTTATFACNAYIKASGGEMVYVTQPTKPVGPLSGGDGTYWIAVHRDLGTAVVGWTRQAGTHYLWQKNATQPANPSNGLIISSVTVSSSPDSRVTAVADQRVSRSLAFTGWADPTDSLYGAVGDGTTDDSTAIASAFAGNTKIRFRPGTYKMGTAVTKSSNNVVVDFGQAVFVNNGPTYLFVFGPTADTSQYTGLRLTGGHWTQADPATASNRNYIHIKAVKDFVVSDMRMDNVSNGGISIWAGAQDGVVERLTIRNGTANGTIRGIWLDGSSASDYASQLVDISSITRNGTPVPVYGVKNVTIRQNTIIGDMYPVYLTNTRYVTVSNNYMDISGSGLRCISINDYSPYAVAESNTCIGNQASTGILVTQYSHDVRIRNNIFLGTFGSGRDVYIQYLAEATIIGNRFTTDSTQQIQVNMGGRAIVKNNEFLIATAYAANYRAVYLSNLDPASAGTSTFGDTATSLASFIFQDNVLVNRLVGIYAYAFQSAGGNYPGIDVITVKDNIFHGYNLSVGIDEYPLRLVVPGSTYPFGYDLGHNKIYPTTKGLRNIASIASGTGYLSYRDDISSALFSVSVAASGGAITVTKQYGGAFDLVVTRSGTALVLSGRSSEAAAGAAAARPVGIVDTGTTMYQYELVQTTNSNWLFQPQDTAGVDINCGTAAVAFDVFLVANKD